MNNLYVGKVFELKKMHRIHWSSSNSRNKDTAQGTMLLEDMGAAVLVVDERTKKVKVITKNKQIVWIAKYYLANEIYSDTTKNNMHDMLNTSMTKLTKLAGRHDVYDDMKTEIFEVLECLRNIKNSLESE